MAFFYFFSFLLSSSSGFTTFSFIGLSKNSFFSWRFSMRSFKDGTEFFSVFGCSSFSFFSSFCSILLKVANSSFNKCKQYMKFIKSYPLFRFSICSKWQMKLVAKNATTSWLFFLESTQPTKLYALLPTGARDTLCLPAVSMRPDHIIALPAAYNVEPKMVYDRKASTY